MNARGLVTRTKFQTRTAYMLVLDIDYRPQCVAHAHQVRDLHRLYSFTVQYTRHDTTRHDRDRPSARTQHNWKSTRPHTFDVHTPLTCDGGRYTTLIYMPCVEGQAEEGLEA